MTILFLASLVLLNSGLPAETRSATATERIYTDILTNYQLVSPIIYPNDSTEVEVGFQLYQVKSLLWEDHRLAWDASNYDDTFFLTIEASKIWVPMIGLKNSVGKVVDPDWRQVYPALVFADGFVQWAPCGKFASSCKLDMSTFPYDTQMCSLDFGNVLGPSEIVNISTAMTSVDLQSFYPSSEFDVDSYDVNRMSYFVVGPAINYTTAELQFFLTLKRKPFYYVLNIIIPTVVLAILSALTFVVPTESGEKLSLGVSILLAFSVFMLILSESTPKTSDNPPILAVYLTVIVTICGSNVVMQMLFLNIYYVTPLRPVPKWLKRVGDCLSCRCLYRPNGVKPSSNKRASVDERNIESEDVDTDQNRPKSKTTGAETALLKEICVLSDKVKSDDEESIIEEEWKVIANLFDRFFFFFFLVVQIIMIIMSFGILPVV